MKTAVTIILSFSFVGVFGQLDTIHFLNPSFERFIQINTGNPIDMPTWWSDCGFAEETPPDVHYSGGNHCHVSRKAVDGKAFIGMVARDNRTWERMGQNLIKPLKAGKCYFFSVDLARSAKYINHSRFNNNLINLNKPIILRIFGGKNSCKKHELLAVSPPIESTDWLGYNFIINPKEEYQHILFEAYYKTPMKFPYNGNILIDNLTHIYEIPCDKNDLNLSLAEINKNLEKHQKYFDKNEEQPVNLAKKRLEEILKEYKEKEEEQRFEFRTNSESTRLANDRKNAVLDLLNDKVEILTKNGLFLENEKGVDTEGTLILNQIIKLLKVNTYLALDIAIKKQGTRKNVTWRINYLRDTFSANGISHFNYDVDKISNYLSTKWPFENNTIAINAYLIN